MDADTAHGLWLGTVNVTVALARGQIVARGPVANVLRLVPLVRPLGARYRAQLEAAGREDLVEATSGPGPARTRRRPSALGSGTPEVRPPPAT